MFKKNIKQQEEMPYSLSLGQIIWLMIIVFNYNLYYLHQIKNNFPLNRAKKRYGKKCFQALFSIEDCLIIV